VRGRRRRETHRGPRRTALEKEIAIPFAAAATIAIGAIFPSLAIGWLGGKAMDALGRNPEAAGPISQNMILAVAFAEAIAIYALIVAIVIVFVA